MKLYQAKSGIFLCRLANGDEVAGFNCGDGDIDSFLKDDALEHHKRDLAIVYLLKNKEGRILGYTSLSMSAIKLENPGIEYKYPRLPSLLIGRLGVNKEEQNNGYGSLLIDIVIHIALMLKKIVGCRFVTADSYPDMVEYYKKQGFETEFSKEKRLQWEEKGRNIPMYFRLR